MLVRVLVPNEPRNIEEWKSLPLWSPHLAHSNVKLVRCQTQAQHRLREGGLQQIGDITTHTGEFLTWNEVAPNPADVAARKAFDKLVSNIRAPNFLLTTRFNRFSLKNWGFISGSSQECGNSPFLGTLSLLTGLI